MKKVLFFLCCIAIAGVGSSYALSPYQTKPAAKAAKKPAAAISKTDIEAGKQLILKSDCLACHKVEEKLLGPAYTEVAKKYPATDANITMLAQKILKGGSGVWGAIPMSPHPAISAKDANTMVKYILSLNTK